MEDIKVKDAIIAANEKLIDDSDIEEPVNMVSCNKCDWTSLNKKQLNGHVRQYICPQCKEGYRTKNEMSAHFQAKYTEKQESVNLIFITCDKGFNSQHSLKQHMNTKHANVDVLPVGHPERAQKKDKETSYAGFSVCKEAKQAPPPPPKAWYGEVLRRRSKVKNKVNR